MQGMRGNGMALETLVRGHCYGACSALHVDVMGRSTHSVFWSGVSDSTPCCWWCVTPAIHQEERGEGRSRENGVDASRIVTIEVNPFHNVRPFL
jgi:hypothetical protein